MANLPPIINGLIYPPAVMAKHPEHAIAIAELIANWNTLEDTCVTMLTLFAGVDPQQSYLIMSAMVSSQARLDSLRAAGNYVLRDDTKALAELTFIFDFLTKRLRVRNKYAHGIYVSNEKKQLCIIRRKYKHGHPQNIEVIHLSGLKKELVQALSIIPRLRAFTDRLYESLSLETRKALIEIWTRQALPPQASRE